MISAPFATSSRCTLTLLDSSVTELGYQHRIVTHATAGLRAGNTAGLVALLPTSSN